MIITPHEQYMYLAKNDAQRREAYRALFRAHVDEALADKIRDATNGNFVLGGKRFQTQIAKALGRRVTRGVAVIKRGLSPNNTLQLYNDSTYK